MKALLKTEEELGFKQLLHANGAEKPSHFDFQNLEELVRGGSVSVEEGLASGKVGKRKSRVSRKVPIKVFTADAANFMAMVHKLTGFQAPAYLLPGSPQTSLLKPLGTQRPLPPFMQGLYTPDPPAGDKTNVNISDEMKSSVSGRQQLNSIFNNGSLSTKEGLIALYGASASANRFPPSIHNPAFEAILHGQGMRNGNSSNSRKEESFTDSFNRTRGS